MGLAISIGYLGDFDEDDPESADRFEQDLANLNAILEQHGLQPHQEPVRLEDIQMRATCGSFPYSFLHYLRRVYAHVVQNPNWHAEPLKNGKDPTKDSVLDREYAMFSSHLLCHSDAEGYYVPQDFTDVIFDDSGGMIGSSHQLLRELVMVAPALGIVLENGELSDAEAKRINEVGASDIGLWIEYIVWIALFEAARLSIEHNTLIVFG
jgi:hypothetical protein